MKYEQLTDDYRDDYILEAAHGRELEHWQHECNAAVYAALLGGASKGVPSKGGAMTDPPALADDFRAQIQKLHDEALAEMAKIDLLHAALLEQVPDPARQEAAKARVEAARAQPVPVVAKP